MSCIWNVKEEDRHCKYCMLTHCEDRKNEKQRRHGRVMPRMKAMDIDEEIVFDPCFYGAARTASYRIRDDFGVKILVSMRDDGVHAIRIS